MAFSKTNRVILPITNVASGNMSKSNALDVSTLLEGTLLVRYGRNSTVAFTAPLVIRVEAALDSGATMWLPKWMFQSDLGANLVSQAISSDSAAAQNRLNIGNTAIFALQDFVYCKNATLANSEWGFVDLISANAYLQLLDNLNNDQPTTSTVYRYAQYWTKDIDLAGIKQLRAVVDATGTGQAVDAEVRLITADSFTSG